MANITECDGCGARIGNGLGETPLGMSGQITAAPGRAGSDFHFCERCAGIARKAVYEAMAAGQEPEVDKIRDMMAEAQEHPGRIVTR